MILMRRACRRYRPLLLDLAERAERGVGAGAALEHLAACRACEQEVMGIVLTAAALRRAGAAYRRLPEPIGHAVPMPRASTGWGGWTWRLQLGSLGTAAFLAAIVVAPRVAPPVTPAPGPATVSSTPTPTLAVPAWRVAEQRLASRPDPGPIAEIVVKAGSLPVRYPDALFKPWKEVATPDASVRVLEPQ